MTEENAANIIKEMINTRETITGLNEILIEEVKAQVCDHYCRYPDEYKTHENDANWERMIEEKCVDCPLTAL